MGLFEMVKQARNPKQRTWPVGKGVVLPSDKALGHDDSLYVPEDYGDYLATSADVYAAASLRARLISGLRLQLFRGVGPTRKEVTRGPAVELLRRVNPHWTAARLARMDELSMCLWGESYWAVERDTFGVPSEIWWMKAPRVAPAPDEDNYLKGYWYTPQVGGKPIWFSADEVIWFRYPNPLDEFAAMSPVAAARLAADTGSAMMKANRNIFDNGLQMAAMVVPANDRATFSKEQADELSDGLERRFRGVDKRHKWAVLRYEAQIKEVGITPHDAEFVAGLNLTLRQVANAYGVPSPLLNDMEHATLANLRELLTAVWTLALVPDSQLKAAEIAEQFLPLFPGRRPDEAEYDYTRVPELQEVASDVWARERQAIEVGRKTINEIRLANGEPPVPWGDAWWCPANKFAVTAEGSKPGVAEQQTPADEPTSLDEQSTDERARRLLLSAFNGDRPPINGHARSH